MEPTNTAKFKWLINLEHAVATGLGIVLFLAIPLQITVPWMLAAGFVFGLCGGSVSELVSFLRNKDAITSYGEKNEK